ncbi:MAG: spore germination protein [Clostridia bacterium]|nr:spore germination protein [Clostridia bacterium]
MDKRNNELLTQNELLFTLIGIIIGAGILSLPNAVVSEAKQDGWISTIIGSIYPFYIILVGAIIIKKYPDNSIMDVSKLCFGRVLGNLLNLLFMAQFLLYVLGVIGAAHSILRVYAVWFMTPFKITLVLLLVVVYISIIGLKCISKLNILMFFIILLYMISSLTALKVGSLLNIQPVFGAGLEKIIKGSIETTFSYGNMELLLLIYPFVRSKVAVVKTALKAAVIVMVLYTWTVFITIFYLGPDVIPKALWPFFFVSESVKIPVITSFRFIAMALWTLVIIKTATNQYYGATAILNNMLKRIDRKYICIALAPIILIFSLLFDNEVARRDFFSKVMPWVTLFNIGYVTIVAVFALILNKKPTKPSAEYMS